MNWEAKIGGYGKKSVASRAKIFDRVTMPMNDSLVRSVLGVGILKSGILSVDYVHQTVYLQPFYLVEVKDDVLGSRLLRSRLIPRSSRR